MIKIVNAKSAGECSACHQSYAPGTVLLVTGSGNDAKLIGCANCQSLMIKAKIARVSGKSKPYPSDRDKYKCEACGKWENAGTGKITFKAKIEGEQYTKIVGCGQCPDLSPAEQGKIAAGPSEEQQRTIGQKQAQQEHARTQRAPETADEALVKLGNWAEAMKTLALDPTLEVMARRRKMDLNRLYSAFSAQAIRDINCNGASVDSWITAFRDALQLGTYPGKGPFAESYLIARYSKEIQMQEVSLQAGYKCVAAVILTVPGTNIKVGTAWPCQAILGNLAAPYHTAVRQLRRAEKEASALLKVGIYDPRPVEAAKQELREAAEQVKANGAKMLARIPADVKDANQRSMRDALNISAETHGRDWFTWEWYRFHGPTDLLIQDYPSATFWKPPALRNSDGQVPSLACCLIERRNAPPIACEIPSDQVIAIAVKGRQATMNGKGGLNGTVWGDDLGAHHMWHKTALLQLALHGRFPLREIDPERAAILSRSEATQEEQDAGGSYLAATVADAARHQSAVLRQRQHPVPQLGDGGAPGEDIEWDDREQEYAPVGDEQDEEGQEEYPEPGSQG